MGYTLYDAAWLFFIYAVIGWATEVIYATTKNGTFVNRGFLGGPVCPIYGFGVLFVVFALTPISTHLPILFIGAVIITSTLEYLTGFLLKVIFHDMWWDYSEEPFNLHGYICLRFSLLWGLACVFVIRVVEPTVEYLYRAIPHTLGLVLLGVFSTVILADLTVTVIGISRLPAKLQRLAEIRSAARTVSDRLGRELSDYTNNAMELGAELKEKGTELKEHAPDIRGLASDVKEFGSETLDGLRTELSTLAKKERGLYGLVERRITKAFPRFGSDRNKK